MFAIVGRSRPLILGAVGAVILGCAVGAIAISAVDPEEDSTDSVIEVPDPIPAYGDGSESFASFENSETPASRVSRSQPPKREDLAPGAGLLFPKGVTYQEALRSYYVARQRGDELPVGIEVVRALPIGKVIQIREDGRIVLDSAAPMGVDDDGRVHDATFTMPGSLSGKELSARFREAEKKGLALPRGATMTINPIPRCQVIFSGQAGKQPSCDATDADKRPAPLD